MIKKTEKWNIAAQKLICLMLVYGIVYGTPVMFGVPNVIKFLNDLVLLAITVLTILSPEERSKILKTPFFAAVAVTTAYYAVSGLVSGTGILPMVWDFRGMLRPMLFGCICLGFVTENRFHDWMKLLTILYWVNAAVFLVQFAFGARMDFLGGLFGIELGVNGRNNVFFCVIVCYQIARYLEGKEGTLKTMAVLSSSVLLAALSELKIYFVEAACIIAAVVFLDLVKCFLEKRMDKADRKKYGILVLCLLVSYIGALVILYLVYPLAFKQMTQAKRFVKYDSGCSAYKLGRLTAFKNISDMFFHWEPVKMLFGSGFGSFVDSNVSAMQGVNFPEFGDLNYSWFTFQLNYLETGLLGVILYCGTIVVPGIQAAWGLLRGKCGEHFSLYACTLTMCPIMLLLYVYNNSLRGEMAYLAFLCLAAWKIAERRDEYDLDYHTGT